MLNSGNMSVVEILDFMTNTKKQPVENDDIFAPRKGAFETQAGPGKELP